MCTHIHTSTPHDHICKHMHKHTVTHARTHNPDARSSDEAEHACMCHSPCVCIPTRKPASLHTLGCSFNFMILAVVACTSLVAISLVEGWDMTSTGGKRPSPPPTWPSTGWEQALSERLTFRTVSPSSLNEAAVSPLAMALTHVVRGRG